MKNGVLVYPVDYTLFNVGDYIQSLAARQHFDGEVDVYLQREALNEYDGQAVKVILNGWFMHRPETWPPSPLIHPLFVSFHINSVAVEEMLRSESVQYLRSHQPIGCRDRGTAELLKGKGVDAYFSGCLTLTLGKTYKRSSDAKGIVFVDPYYPIDHTPAGVLNAVLVMKSNFKTVKRIALARYSTVNFKSLIKASQFYKYYSQIFEDEVLESATYVEQELPNANFSNDDEKFAFADKLLRNYSSSQYVVTSRIHCALPCLGIGTPVLYVNNVNQSETSYCRLDGLLELFNVIHFDNGVWAGFGIEAGSKFSKSSRFDNQTRHHAIVASLIDKCEKFAAAI